MGRGRLHFSRRIFRRFSGHLTAMATPSRALARTGLKVPCTWTSLARLTIASAPQQFWISIQNSSPTFRHLPPSAISRRQYPRDWHISASGSGVSGVRARLRLRARRPTRRDGSVRTSELLAYRDATILNHRKVLADSINKKQTPNLLMVEPGRWLRACIQRQVRRQLQDRWQ
jgi:hypothetical protein